MHPSWWTPLTVELLVIPSSAALPNGRDNLRLLRPGCLKPFNLLFGIRTTASSSDGGRSPWKASGYGEPVLKWMEEVWWLIFVIKYWVIFASKSLWNLALCLICCSWWQWIGFELFFQYRCLLSSKLLLVYGFIHHEQGCSIRWECAFRRSFPVKLSTWR